MKSINHIFIFLLCIIITYTGSGFAEIHYNCVGCVDNDLEFSRLFYPSKISTRSGEGYECCQIAGNTQPMINSCCGTPSQSLENKNNCRETKITKLDVTRENVPTYTEEIKCVYLSSATLFHHSANLINENQSKFINDISPPYFREHITIIYCTLLI